MQWTGSERYTRAGRIWLRQTTPPPFPSYPRTFPIVAVDRIRLADDMYKLLEAQEAVKMMVH